MNTATSKGVKISVKKLFQSEHSNVNEQLFLFNYTIQIENQNTYPIQLVSRHWRIFDSLNKVRHVNGNGVIGAQPVIEAGEVYEYSSACNLVSELGHMEGFYDFAQLHSDLSQFNTFQVTVPRFKLEYPYKLN